MSCILNRIWKTLRQCVGESSTSTDENERYHPVRPADPSPSQSRSASPDSLCSVSIRHGSSGSECSGDTWKEYEELRKGFRYARNRSVENTSMDSGYESADI
ncbi:hypothetical protein CAEBREN_05599 [Caenorhabditis brenneri]|uniref:Uncharacterized protein n=1 Tax=Caenorhabditis brenneri TaxID=135651 RepID=G0N5R7_CAEBE|nr:hypothetical protein CAEBREN_05599 [Caenorhabditis brenneri]